MSEDRISRQTAEGSGIAQAIGPNARASVVLGITAEQLQEMVRSGDNAQQEKINDLSVQLRTTVNEARRFIKILAERDVPLNKLLQTLVEIADQYGTRLPINQKSSRYLTVPPLPPNFVDRPEDIATLRGAVLSGDSRNSIALTALNGMGGIGKTVLAQALCRDHQIQQTFTDGIVWIAVGKELQLDLVSRLHEVGRALNEDLTRYSSELECTNAYRGMIHNKAALVILDDIWRSRDIEPFRADAPHSRLLFTTRDASVAAAVGAAEHVAGMLTLEQAQAVLAAWAKLQVEDLPPLTAEVIRECGRLPLALTIVGAILRGKGTGFWKQILDRLRNADLADIKAHLGHYAHESVFRAIEVSVEELTDRVRQRYLALAVLLEEMPADPIAQQVLWGTDKSETAETSMQLVSLSLAHFVGELGSIGLHDLQLDYVRAKYPNRPALKLIHGAVRLSSHIFSKDPSQFAPQIFGRLLPYQGVLGIAQLLERIRQSCPRPWLKPQWPTLRPPSSGLFGTLEGPSNPISLAALSVDGRLAASFSEDKTLRVWDVERGRQLHVLFKGDSWQSNRRFWLTDDGICFLHDYGTLKAWHLETGRFLQDHVFASRYTDQVAVSADGRRAVSANRGTIRVYDLKRQRHLSEFKNHHWDSFRALTINSDGTRAVFAYEDYGIRNLMAINLESGSVTDLQYDEPILCTAMSGDGQYAAASSGKTFRVWNISYVQQPRVFSGHLGSIRGLCLSRDGQFAISASEDKTLKIWDLVASKQIRSVQEHAAPVLTVAMSSDGQRAVSGSEDGILKVWDVQAMQELLQADTHPVIAVTGGLNKNRAMAVYSDGTLRVLDLGNGSQLQQWRDSEITSMVVSADGRRAVSSSTNNMLKVWDLETFWDANWNRKTNLNQHGHKVVASQGHAASQRALAVSAGGQFAISAYWDATLTVWDLANQHELRTIVIHQLYYSAITAVAINNDGSQAVSGSSHGEIGLWQFKKPHKPSPPRRFKNLLPDECRCVTLTLDGLHALCGSTTGALFLYELQTGTIVRLGGHSGPVRALAISPDGKRVVSVSDDKTVKIWNLLKHEIIAVFTCESAALCCAFLNSQSVLAGDQSGRVYHLEILEKS